jgi:hypothetical protein
VPRICARLLGSLLCCCPSGEKELQWSVGALSPPAAHSWLATAWLPTHRSVGSSLALLPRLARRLRSSYYMQIYGVLSSQRCHWIIEREGERDHGQFGMFFRVITISFTTTVVSYDCHNRRPPAASSKSSPRSLASIHPVPRPLS